MDARGLYGGVSLNKWAPVPKLPPLFILTDRNNPNVKWLLTHNEAHNHISITTDFVLPRFAQFTICGPYDGPYLHKHPSFWVRLFVRGSHLGWEQVTDQSWNVHNPRIITRRGSVKVFRQLYIPVNFPRNEPHLAWREWVA